MSGLSQIGQKALQKSRENAEAKLSALELPTYKNENYRFTPLKGLNWDRQPTSAPLPSESVADRGDEDLVFSVGRETPKLSGGGYTIGNLEDALSLLPVEALKKLDELLKTTERFQEDLFAQLAMARWNRGAVIYVEPGARVELPVRLVHEFSSEMDSFFFRNFVILGRGAELKLVDEYVGDASSGEDLAPIACGMTQVHAADGSRLDWTQIQRFGSKVDSFLRQEVSIGRDAQVTARSLNFGGNRSQHRLESRCEESGARFEFQGANRGSEKQLFDSWVASHHDVAHTEAQMEICSVMGGRAKAVFNGNIVIGPKGLHTQAFQQNRNLLLSDKAVIDSIPKLEIATDEVTCAHGSTTSSVDPSQLYYLQSRGLDADEAETMIVEGFTEPVIRKIPQKKVRLRAREWLSGDRARAQLWEEDPIEEGGQA